MIKDLIFESGYITIVKDNDTRVKVPITSFIDYAEDVDITTHAALATGVHGAGASTLATVANITTHTAIAAAHHARYTDGEVVTAMGVKGDSNPLNHDKYTDAEALAAVEAKQTPVDIDISGTAAIATLAHKIREGTPTNAAPSSLSTDLAGDNNDLVFTAVVEGESGNDISVEYINPGTPSAALSVVLDTGKITVNLATDAGVKASTTIGSGENGTVTITDDAIGTQGNSKTVEVVVGTTPSGSLAAAINAGAIVVTLGVDAGTKASGTLTISDNATDDVIDGEIVTIGGDEVYEFDWNASYTGGRIQVDISAKASIAKAKGTLTLSGVPVHNETFVIDADTFTIKHDGTTGANVIDLTACATADYGQGMFGLATLPVDTDTITINGRVYEFDTNSSITGDVAININGLTTIDAVLAAIETAINNDGSAVVEATDFPDDNYVLVVAKVIGTVGNYVVSESCGAGGWLPDEGFGGTMLGGADPTVEEVVDQIVADFDGTTCNVTKKDADQVYVEYGEFGTAGNIIVFTEALTGGAVDGAGVLGGTTTGADCSKEDAIAALTAAIIANTAKEVTPTDNLDGTMTLVHNTLPYTVGNSFGTTEGMAQGAWGGAVLSGGIIPAVDNAKNTATLVATAVANLSGVTAAASGTGADPLTIAEAQENLSGGAEPAITTIASEIDAACAAEPTVNAIVGVANKADNNGTGLVIAMAETNLSGYTNGTTGAEGDMYRDDTYLYICIATNGIVDNNWRRIALGSAY